MNTQQNVEFIDAILDNETDGTHYQGIITASYQSMVATFGEPMIITDSKTRAEWTLQTPHGIATIYDWKEYQTPLSDVTEWHIGGHNDKVVEYINQKWYDVNTPF